MNLCCKVESRWWNEYLWSREEVEREKTLKYIKCIAPDDVETCSLYSKFSDWNPLSWCFVRWWMDWRIVKGWIQHQPTPPSVVTTFSTEFIESLDHGGVNNDEIISFYNFMANKTYYNRKIYLFVLCGMKTKRYKSSARWWKS